MQQTQQTAEGLRERKKRLTRAAIFAAAERLFSERGFEDVTVAEIADAANISVKTLFTYVRAKEELVFSDAPNILDAPPNPTDILTKIAIAHSPGVVSLVRRFLSTAFVSLLVLSAAAAWSCASGQRAGAAPPQETGDSGGMGFGFGEDAGAMSIPGLTAISITPATTALSLAYPVSYPGATTQLKAQGTFQDGHTAEALVHVHATDRPVARVRIPAEVQVAGVILEVVVGITDVIEQDGRPRARALHLHLRPKTSAAYVREVDLNLWGQARPAGTGGSNRPGSAIAAQPLSTRGGREEGARKHAAGQIR